MGVEDSFPVAGGISVVTDEKTGEVTVTEFTGGFAHFERLPWRRSVDALVGIGYLDVQWNAVDETKYPEEPLLGPGGRVHAMAADLLG